MNQRLYLFTEALVLLLKLLDPWEGDAQGGLNICRGLLKRCA